MFLDTEEAHIPFYSCTLSGIQISLATLGLSITASPPLPRSLSFLSFSVVLSLFCCIITQVIVESSTASPPSRKLCHHLINSWNKHHMLLEGGQVLEEGRKEGRKKTGARLNRDEWRT